MNLADVSGQNTELQQMALDWVGMEGIAIPIAIQQLQVAAKTSVFVAFRSEAGRGIHMSRLYAAVEDILAGKELSWQDLLNCCHQLCQSHSDIAEGAKLSLQFDLMLKRRSLQSDLEGFRSYPVEVILTVPKKSFGLAFSQRLEARDVKIELAAEVLYSSTCPASAALSKQVVRQNIENLIKSDRSIDRVLDWITSNQGLGATPHAQRSRAQVKVALSSRHTLTLSPAQLAAEFIDAIEAALGTPVQTRVKREDEQAFARLNSENLMFCEDAARRILTKIKSNPSYSHISGKVCHLESLHAHDAVAIFSAPNESAD